jgi:hypothetical protein
MPIKPGFYWVQHYDHDEQGTVWDVGRHMPTHIAPYWKVIGHDRWWSENEFRKIGPRIPDPDEGKPSESELVERAVNNLARATLGLAFDQKSEAKLKRLLRKRGVRRERR